MKPLRLIPVFAALLLAACSAAPQAGDDDTSVSHLSMGQEGTYHLYFTNPMPDLVERGVFDSKQPDVEKILSWDIADGRRPDQRLLQLINDAGSGSECSVLVADYDFDIQEIADSMAAAKARGCDVRLVTDGDTIDHSDPDTNRVKRHKPFRPEYEKPFQTLRTAGIQIHHDGARGAIMHDKFAVIDKSIVWTGSWNWSGDDLTKFWNDAFVMQSKDAAVRYGATFESLFARWDENGIQQKEWKAPAPPEDHHFKLGDIDAEIYFPSSDKATPRLTELVESATTSVHFLAFAFTSKEIGDAMLDRAANGVEIKGIFENSGACNGQYAVLAAAPAGENITLGRWIYGPQNFMHHKVIVVDGKTVAFSSFNFSDSADNGNDENVLIINDEKIASAFEEEYTRVALAVDNMKSQAPACTTAAKSESDAAPTSTDTPVAVSDQAAAPDSR